jgi:hypothetical protein
MMAAPGVRFKVMCGLCKPLSDSPLLRVGSPKAPPLIKGIGGEAHHFESHPSACEGLTTKRGERQLHAASPARPNSRARLSSSTMNTLRFSRA